MGDSNAGGERSSRLWLHSSRLSLRHPAGPLQPADFAAPTPSFAAEGSPPVWGVVSAAVVPSETDCFRLSHGLGTPGGSQGVFVDALGPALLVQADSDLSPGAQAAREGVRKVP